MNYSEYLRRKMEQLPVVYGPSKYADESTRIMAARYKASIRRPVGEPIVSTCCRGPTPYWRSGGGRPDAGPYPRAANGQQQMWSSEFIAASAAGCAVCKAGKAGYVYKACCPPESIPEAPRNPVTGAPEPERKALAYKGKETCCPVVGPTLQSLPPDCSCAVGPGRQNTLLANDMPSDEIPYPVPIRNCKRCAIVTTTTDCDCGDC